MGDHSGTGVLASRALLLLAGQQVSPMPSLRLALALLLYTLALLPPHPVGAAVGPSGPCRQLLADLCQAPRRTPAALAAGGPPAPAGQAVAVCQQCAGKHQARLRQAGCSADDAARWCGRAGTGLTCFDDGECVSLARVSATAAEHSALNATCLAGSPTHFKWGPPAQLCEWTGAKPFVWNVYMEQTNGSSLLQIPGMDTQFWSEMQALFMQAAFYEDNEKGIPALLAAGRTLPANYRVPLVLISSALNRLRDLPPGPMGQAAVHAVGENGPPRKANVPVGAAAAPSSALVVFSGLDGQTGGRDHPALPSCNNDTRDPAVPQNITGYDYISFSLRLSHAMIYAGAAGTLQVWETDTAGNTPFSGEWEYIPSPGATFKQLRENTSGPHHNLISENLI